MRFGVDCEQRVLAAGQWLTIGRSWNRANAESCACTLQAYSTEVDDPLLGLELHAKTVDLLRTLFSVLANMCEGSAPSLTAEQRSYLAQEMDSAAELDIVFELLAGASVVLPPTTPPGRE